MATVRGREGVRRYMGAQRDGISRSLLPGAARAGGAVIRDEAKDRATSDAVKEKIAMTVKRDGDQVIARIGLSKGWSLAVGIWLEYGTDPHYITVDDSQRQGMSANRINRLKKREGVLVINGQPVGKTVLHPGAKPNPFLRPALDTKEAEAVVAAQAYINSRVGPAGIAADSEGIDE